MTSLTHTSPVPYGGLHPLIERQPLLAWFGLALLAAMPLPLLASLLDPRLLASGISPWIKPAKFLLSTAVFVLTSAFFYGYVAPAVREGRLLRRAAILAVVAAGFEIFWISWQAANGVDSHFNEIGLVNMIMFGLMGVFALLLAATALPLAWAIARHPRTGLDPVHRNAAVIGLVLTWLLGSISGMAMGANGAHAIGPEASAIPLFHWNQIGGDIRPAHFLGMHAEQIIPAGAALLGLAGLTLRQRRAALLTGSGLFVLLFAALMALAFSGRPLIPA